MYHICHLRIEVYSIWENKREVKNVFDPPSFSIQEMFVINQHLLNALGVGHPSLDQVFSIASQFGLAAKLTGGGGGGCAIILIHPGESTATAAARSLSFMS